MQNSKLFAGGCHFDSCFTALFLWLVFGHHFLKVTFRIDGVALTFEGSQV